MKFSTGDCISFKIDDTLFLAGFISGRYGDKYEITLGDYRQQAPPPADYFNDCLVFSTKYEFNEMSTSAVDIVVFEPEYLDQSANIELVTQVKVSGFLTSSGYQKVSDINELTDIFESWIKLRDQIQDKNSAVTGFEIKCFRNINEVLKSALPPPEFPTVKLYKEIEGIIHYWQIYGRSNDPASLVIHWGRLGETGEFTEVKDRTLEELREMYKTQIADKKSEGYGDPERLRRMILQFPTSDEWGASKDLDFRNETWDYLDGFLFWTGNGAISGGDIGSGTINLFFGAVMPDMAVDTIVNALEQKKNERPFLIAIDNSEDGMPDDGSFGIKVLYPNDYKYHFFY